jgi:hypothetical protein
MRSEPPTINVTKADVAGIFERVTETAAVDCADAKVNYAVAKTLDFIEAQHKAIEKARALPKAYAKAHTELTKKHAAKDDKGNPKVVPMGNDRFSYELADAPAFEAELKALRAEHKMDDWDKSLDELLAQEIALPFYPIPIKKDESPWKTPRLLANVIRFVAEP